MKNKLNYVILSIISILIVFIIFTSINMNTPNIPCPFTEVPWNNTMEKMLDIEGKNYKTYNSIYDGLTYSYPKKYLGLDGTIKYMYNDTNEIQCMAWAYNADNITDLESIYTNIEFDLISKYGESDYQPDQKSNKGHVWYLDEYNIILSAMTTETQKVIQYSYTLSEK